LQKEFEFNSKNIKNIESNPKYRLIKDSVKTLRDKIREANPPIQDRPQDPEFLRFLEEQKNKPRGVGPAIQDQIAEAVAGSAADDTVAKTPGWDARLVAAIQNIPLGISYPNDLLQGKNLPSNGTCFDSRIPRALGYLAPPTLFHLYMDNFWRLLGTELGTLVYCEDIILEHNHYVNKKAPTDNTYKTINSQEMYSLDSSAFNDYKDSLLTRDLARLHASLETE
jgi:hypothetical protein